jgi:CRP-like cAMP-binding protein
VGPAAIVQAHRFIFDDRDQGAQVRLSHSGGGNGVWRCRTIYNCVGGVPARYRYHARPSLNGALQMGKATTRGRRQIICNPQAESCGGVCMLAFGPHALAEVRGMDSGQVLILDRADFEALIHEDRVLCRAAWHSAASCMSHLSSLVAQLSFNKVSERVALALLEDTEKDGDLVRLTQADLAAEVGTTREVVARCLAGLQADGLIRLGRARITVLNRAGLERAL